MGNGATVTSWTCERCEVTTSWMPGVEVPRLPPNWSKQAGVLYCLGCQRELAGEDGVASLPEDAPADDRRKQHSYSRIAFEIGRDPLRPDQQIAKVCRTSVVAVRRARERIGSPNVTAKSQGA